MQTISVLFTIYALFISYYQDIPPTQMNTVGSKQMHYCKRYILYYLRGPRQSVLKGVVYIIIVLSINKATWDAENKKEGKKSVIIKELEKEYITMWYQWIFWNKLQKETSVWMWVKINSRSIQAQDRIGILWKEAYINACGK